MTRKKFSLLLVCSVSLAATYGGRAEYVGGTIQQIPSGCDGRVEAVDPTYFVFYAKTASWRIEYTRINLLEYGQKVDRRVMAAVLVSPLFLLSKKRQHFLTVGYEDANGQQQAMIFRVSKGDVRAMLVSLEARTGRRVEYQDDDARRAGKG